MTMKNQIKIYRNSLALLLSAIAVGCTSVETIDSRQETPRPVAFSLQTAPTVTTRAASTLDNLWPSATVISISNGTNVYNYQTAAESSSTDDAVTLSPVSSIFYWPVDDPGWSFSAWYPATASPTSTSTATASITVNADQTETTTSEATYKSYDLLYCPPTTATFWATVPLVFHHQMARVIVMINSDGTEGHDEMVGSETVRKKEVVTNVALGGTNRLGLTGTITTFSTTGANGSTVWNVATKGACITKMRPLASHTNAASNLYAFECILPPQKDETADAPLIDITTSGAEDHNHQLITRTYTYKSAFDYKAGYQYTYNLAISEQGTVTLDRVKVEGWDATVVGVSADADYPNNSYPE